MRALCFYCGSRPSTSFWTAQSVAQKCWQSTAAAAAKPRPDRGTKHREINKPPPTAAALKISKWFNVAAQRKPPPTELAKSLFEAERELNRLELGGLLRADRPLQLQGADWSARNWSTAHASLGVPALLSIYSQLAKDRLTVMVTITALAGYVVAVPVLVTDGFSLATLTGVTVGTALMSASANTFNQLLEIPYDAQMRRTQARTLVRGAITPIHACMFGLSSAAIGFAILSSQCNMLTALLGLTNIALYSGVYTPLKRVSISCTWAGAVVGAIPPLMGWAACTGVLTPAAGTMALILYAWQFPHFNALSWNLRGDYSKAGYRVMCVTDPRLCIRTTLRYSYILLALCSGAAPLTHLTSWSFAIDSLPFNIMLIYLSHQFARHPDAQTSRRLFRYTLAYLPMMMLLLMVGAFERERQITPVTTKEKSLALPQL